MWQQDSPSGFQAFRALGSRWDCLTLGGLSPAQLLVSDGPFGFKATLRLNFGNAMPAPGTPLGGERGQAARPEKVEVEEVTDSSEGQRLLEENLQLKARLATLRASATGGAGPRAGRLPQVRGGVSVGIATVSPRGLLAVAAAAPLEVAMAALPTPLARALGAVGVLEVGVLDAMSDLDVHAVEVFLREVLGSEFAQGCRFHGPCLFGGRACAEAA